MVLFRRPDLDRLRGTLIRSFRNRVNLGRVFSGNHFWTSSMLPGPGRGVATRSRVITLGGHNPLSLLASCVGAGWRDDGDPLVVEHCCYL